MDIKPDLTKLHEAGITRYTRDFPPAHFTLKVQTFSNSREEKYESGEFESGGYNWRLSFYPRGDKTRNGAGYISLYLSLSDTSRLPVGGEILVNYKLFVFDQLRDKYLTVHDNPGGIRRFNNINKEWGFAQLISLDTFNEASNGYLLGDSCLFGAEVFVIKNSGQFECLSMVKEVDNKTFTWKISSFSSLPDARLYSDMFTVGNYNWRLLLDPKGTGVGTNTHLSFFLECLDLQNLSIKRKLCAEFTLRIRDDVNDRHYGQSVKRSFTSLYPVRGFQNFLPLNILGNDIEGFLVEDSIVLSVKFLSMPRLESSSTKG